MARPAQGSVAPRCAIGCCCAYRSSRRARGQRWVRGFEAVRAPAHVRAIELFAEGVAEVSARTGLLIRAELSSDHRPGALVEHREPAAETAGERECDLAAATRLDDWNTVESARFAQRLGQRRTAAERATAADGLPSTNRRLIAVAAEGIALGSAVVREPTDTRRARFVVFATDAALWIARPDVTRRAAQVGSRLRASQAIAALNFAILARAVGAAIAEIERFSAVACAILGAAAPVFVNAGAEIATALPDGLRVADLAGLTFACWSCVCGARAAAAAHKRGETEAH